MTPLPSLTEITFHPSRDHERRKGLLGWISFTLGRSVRIEGATLRRKLDGRLGPSFPARVDGTGRMRFYIRPLDDAIRREIERQILAQLGLEEESR